MTAFSVVVPTFARPEQLASCLRALARLDAPHGGWELIVVDDGSPGGVEHVVEQVVEQWSGAGVEVRLIAQQNAGPAAARNRGAADARSKHLAFTDDDCAPHVDWLIQLQSCLAEYPDDLVGGPTTPLSDDLWVTASEMIVEFIRDGGRHDGPTVLPSNNLACRTKRFHEIGGFDTTFPSAAGEDREFCRRWTRSGGEIRLCPQAVVEHDHSPGLASFWRQHEGYGRGAVRYRRRTADAEGPAGVGFVAAMVAHPLRTGTLQGGPVRRVGVAACIALSQLAVARGVIGERIAPTDCESDHIPRIGKHT